jgi:hypothetical protein
MSNRVIVVKGTLKSNGALEFDEQPALEPGRVEITLRSLEGGEPRRDWWEVLQQIWKAQQERGHRGRSKEEIDADLAAMRADEEKYEERWREIWVQTEGTQEPGEGS